MEQMVPITIEALDEGQVRAQIDEYIAQAIRDTQGRNHIKTPRKIKVEIAILPHNDGATGEFTPLIKANVGYSKPGTVFATDTAFKRNGEFQISGASPEQTEIEEAIDNVTELQTAAEGE